MLYLVNGLPGCSPGYLVYGDIHVFEFPQCRRIAQSSNGSGPFNFEYDPDCPSFDEPEGLTIWDLEGTGSPQRAKFAEVFAGMDIAYRLARKHRLKTAWGTDIIFSAALARRQGELLVKLERWYTPAEALAMATGTNAELLALSGKRNPYPGKLGVVEEGALADLLLVDGDPLKNIKLIADPARNFVVIMKDGKIYKNLIR